MPKIYTKEHLGFIRSVANGKCTSEILILVNDKYPELNMTRNKLRSLMSNHEIKNNYSNKGKSKYTKEQVDFLMNCIPGNPDKVVLDMFYEKFGILLTEGIIGNFKTKYKVKNGLVGGQFIKGHVSWNKGKKWADFMSEQGQKNSLKTTFKKGNLPANRSEVGTERITKEGYIQVKIQDGKGNRNWIEKHRLVYENVFGKVPKGQKIIFLDGNRMNCSIDNLKAVSDYENLMMNQQKLYSKNKELTESGILIAKIMCKGNKLKRQK